MNQSISNINVNGKLIFCLWIIINFCDLRITLQFIHFIRIQSLILSIKLKNRTQGVFLNQQYKNTERMSELNAFVNMTQLRKINQDTLKPIVSQIEDEISKIKKESQFLKEQSQKAQIIFQNQKKFQYFMTQTQQHMRDVKIKIQQLKDQDLKQILHTKKEVTSLNEQVLALKRQRTKYQEMIIKQKKQNERILENFNKYQLWMDGKVQSMNKEYLVLKRDTLEMTAHVKNDYNWTQAKFKQLEKQIQNKMLANNKKYQILELYLTEREQIKLKLIELQDKFAQYAPIHKIEYLRMCQIKQLQMNKNQISQILDSYLPPEVKQMLPSIQHKVKEIDRITEQIKDIKENVFESEQQMNNFKQTTQSLQSNFRKQFKEINKSLTENIQRLQTDVQVALTIDQKQTQQRKKFEKIFSHQIQTFVKKQNQQTFNKIQQETVTKLDQRQKQESSKMQQKTDMVEKRCQQIKQISENIDKLLTAYNSRIVKIRSDTELFKNQVIKEMKLIGTMRQQNADRFEDIGKIVASLIEILLANMAVEMNLDYECLRNDNFAFSTYNDGLIYHLTPIYTKDGQKNNLNQITYRRNQLEIPHLKRSIMTSVVRLVDRIYQSYPYLQWKSYPPSNFFKDQILSNYLVQVEKYRDIFRQNEQLTQNNSDIGLKKKQNTSLQFRRSKISDKAYSPPKKQNLAMTITLQPESNIKAHEKTVNFNQLGQHIDQNIELHVPRGQSSFILSQNDKNNIKRTIRTIHEVHPRDSNNNRILMSSFANSYFKQANKTIDQVPQSAGGPRKRYTTKQRKQMGQSRYNNNNTQTFMTSRSSKRAASIGHYKLC